MGTYTLTLDIATNAHPAQDEDALLPRKPYNANDFTGKLRYKKTITRSG